MEVRWLDDGRERVAHFTSEAEARRCAEGLRARGVQDLTLVDDDGEPAQNPTLTLLLSREIRTNS
jgi:hypothetical protein